MGLEQSKPVAQWQSEDVAAATETLGKHYQGYADAMRENGVDGSFLASLSDAEIQETLDDLGVESRLHRRLLERKLAVVLERKLAVVLENSIVYPKWEHLNDSMSLLSGPTPSARKSMTEKEEETKKLLELMTAAAEQQMQERYALVQKEAELTEQIRKTSTTGRAA